MKSENKKTALHLLVNTIVLAVLYYLITYWGFPYIFFVYLAAGAILGIVYVVYNKGFVAKNATLDTLPDTMSVAEKQAFIEDGKRRFRASRWMLTLLLPIVLTFLIDMIYLFFLPYLKELFV